MAHQSKPYFHITTGDTDGVGLEVTLKALNLLPKSIFESNNFLIWVHTSQLSFIKNGLNHSFDVIEEVTLGNNLQFKQPISFYVTDHSPAMWFELATIDCLNKNGTGIITAPMSKQESFALGHNDLGHTEILKRLTNIQDLHMAFIGKFFNVVLYSDHITLNSVQVEKESLKYFLDLTLLLNSKFKNYELKLLGLNPHAGDKGLIGSEDDEIKAWLKEWGLNEIQGPIPADSAFCNYQEATPATFASLYHDQGLIPFKMAHGFTGYHTTLGLPFIRTSVDHGTGKEIFNTNTADSTSMKDAIIGAINIHKGTFI